MTAKKKLLVSLAAFACVVAIVAISVLSTIAYFTSSAVLSNTFTIGNVGITLTESKVSEDGKLITGTGAGTTTTGNTYRLIPGTTYVKDPVITVTAGSEQSYLFVMIRNDIHDLEDETNTIQAQMIANGWKYYSKTATSDIYLYCGNIGTKITTTGALDPSGVGGVDKGDIQINIFQEFTLKGDAKIDQNTFNAATIMVRAFAIQTQGFEDDATLGKTAYDKAWEALASAYSYIHTGSSTSGSGDSNA